MSSFLFPPSTPRISTGVYPRLLLQLWASPPPYVSVMSLLLFCTPTPSPMDNILSRFPRVFFRTSLRPLSHIIPANPFVAFLHTTPSAMAGNLLFAGPYAILPGTVSRYLCARACKMACDRPFFSSQIPFGLYRYFIDVAYKHRVFVYVRSHS